MPFRNPGPKNQSSISEVESRLLEQHLVRHGVQIRYQTEINVIRDDGHGRVGGVRLTNGQTFACDLLGAAIGVRPQLDLVQGTSLEVDRGLLVDEHLQTYVPHIYAAGDGAQAYDHWTGQHLLDVLWPTAIAAGAVAGANMAGAGQVYHKGTPFNACLLCGLHITVIGQVGTARDVDDETAVVQHLWRGASEIWATRPYAYASAWVQEGTNSLRLALSGDRLVGALVVGEQSRADPLRELIERQVNVAALRPYLPAGGPALAHHSQQFWQAAQRAAAPLEG